jgi:hypothetical protein
VADLDSSGPYDGASYSEDFWRDFFRHLTGSGVVDGVGSEFAVSERGAGANMSVDVATGECFIRGHWGESTATKNLPISAANATNPRIDRVVLRNHFGDNKITLEVLEGTPAAAPVAPAVTQNAAMWEISLALISVPAADTSIQNAQITSERTIIGFPTFDQSTAPADGDTWTYNATTALWEPAAPSSGTSVPTHGQSMVATGETRATNTFGALSTAQAVSVTTGTKALVMIDAGAFCAGAAGPAAGLAVEVSDATTMAAPAGISETRDTLSGSNEQRTLGKVFVVTGLTPGVNTFTLLFRSYDNVTSITFLNRALTVIDLGS